MMAFVKSRVFVALWGAVLVATSMLGACGDKQSGNPCGPDGCAEVDGLSDICGGDVGPEVLDLVLATDTTFVELLGGADVPSWETMPREDPMAVAQCTSDQPDGAQPVEAAEIGVDCGCVGNKDDFCAEGLACWFQGTASTCKDTFRCQMPCFGSDQCPGGWGCEAQWNDGGTGLDGVSKFCEPSSPKVPLVCLAEVKNGKAHIAAVDGQLIALWALRIDGKRVFAQSNGCDTWEHNYLYMDQDPLPSNLAQTGMALDLAWATLGVPEPTEESPACASLTVLDCEGNWYTCRSLMK